MEREKNGWGWYFDDYISVYVFEGTEIIVKIGKKQ